MLVSQGFEVVKEDGSVKNVFIKSSGVKSLSAQTFDQARIYEKQAEQADYLVKLIESAHNSVARRQCFI